MTGEPLTDRRIGFVRGRKFVRVFVGRFTLTLGWMGPL